MNPADALSKDYGMYYNGCWMEHDKHGVGRVRVNSTGQMFLEFIKPEPIKVRPMNMVCWWPRPGAFNLSASAIYIARRSIRNMRKSAVGQDHYFVKWGAPYEKDVMLVLRDGPNYWSMRRAMAAITSGEMTSVAVSRDVIIYSDVKEEYIVLFRGIEAGTISNGVYSPPFSGHPMTNRILRQLEGLR